MGGGGRTAGRTRAAACAWLEPGSSEPLGAEDLLPPRSVHRRTRRPWNHRGRLPPEPAEGQLAPRLGLQPDDTTRGDILTYKSRLTHPPHPPRALLPRKRTPDPALYLQCIHIYIIERQLYSTESQHSESRQRARVRLPRGTSRGPAWPRGRTHTAGALCVLGQRGVCSEPSGEAAGGTPAAQRGLGSGTVPHARHGTGS